MLLYFNVGDENDTQSAEFLTYLLLLLLHLARPHCRIAFFRPDFVVEIKKNKRKKKTVLNTYNTAVVVLGLPGDCLNECEWNVCCSECT